MLFEVPSWKFGEVIASPLGKKSKGKKKTRPETKANESAETVIKLKVKGTSSYKVRPQKINTEKIPLALVEKDCGVKRKRAEAKLSGARFRYLNQKLYESSSDQAFQYFHEYPDDFFRYHEGFREQTKNWPTNPVDIFIGRLKDIERSPKWTAIKVADMGCGDAKIGKEFAESKKLKVHSFDLVAINEFVTISNMNSVPLLASSIDIVIFCLSLMNKDYMNAIGEAYRVLKPGGGLWIAEVSSRLNGSSGNKKFKESLASWGFLVTETDTSNSVFSLFIVKKVSKNLRATSSVDPVLKPCIYKKR